MANLHDLIPVTAIEKAADIGERTGKALALAEQLRNLGLLKQKYATWVRSDGEIGSIEKQANAELASLFSSAIMGGAEIVVKEKKKRKVAKTSQDARGYTVYHDSSIDEEYEETKFAAWLAGAPEHTRKLAQTPTTRVEKVRAVCDALGFIVFPLEYLDDRSFQSANDNGYYVKQSVERFKEALGGTFHLYVVGPVGHYSVDKHVKSTSGADLPIYAPTSSSQAFMAIQMMIPMFRAMRADIAELKSDYREQDRRMAKVEQEVAALKTRVTRLEADVIAQREAATLQTRRIELASLTRTRWYAEEPLVIAVPKDVDVQSGKGVAFMGPCWGPEFDENVLIALGVNVIEGQRKSLPKVW